MATRLRPGFIDRLVLREESWHYEGGRRDLRLDLLRGFAAFAMIADHIGGEHSWLFAITGGNRFIVSAAEAFVFISGVVMGMVYLSTFRRQGIAAALMKAFGRAWYLYVITVFLTLCFAGLGYSFELWWAPETSNGGVPSFVLNVATLHRTLFLTDILFMYTIFLLGAGPVILLLSQGYWKLVLAASWLLWLSWQISPESASLPWPVEGNSVFFIPSWQVLFVNGIVIGWYRTEIEAWLRRLPVPLLVSTLVLVCLTVTTLLLLQLFALDRLQGSSLLQTLAFNKPDLPIGRLVVFVFLAIFAFALTTLLWQPIRASTAWLLLPLGQNALTAYSLHVILVALTTKLTIDYLGAVRNRDLVDTTLQLGGVLLVWLIVVLEPKVKDWLLPRLGVFWQSLRPSSQGSRA